MVDSVYCAGILRRVTIAWRLFRLECTHQRRLAAPCHCLHPASVSPTCVDERLDSRQHRLSCRVAWQAAALRARALPPLAPHRSPLCIAAGALGARLEAPPALPRLAAASVALGVAAGAQCQPSRVVATAATPCALRALCGCRLRKRALRMMVSHSCISSVGARRSRLQSVRGCAFAAWRWMCASTRIAKRRALSAWSAAVRAPKLRREVPSLPHRKLGLPATLTARAHTD